MIRHVIPLMLMSALSFAAPKEIAMTIDDLPMVGTAGHNPAKLQRKHDRILSILQALKDKQVPATGFIIANSIETGQWELLQDFRNAGIGLGNHTYSHKSANSMSADGYIEEIAKADRILSPIMTEPKFFRFPYLAEGTGDKKKQILAFLQSLHYRVAPVTIDSKDYRFNEELYHIPYRERPARLPALIKRYVAYIWSQTERAERQNANNEGHPVKQILLIHANLLNSHALPAIIEMYQEHGYKFIPLIEAIPEPMMPIQSLREFVIHHQVYCKL